MRKKIFLSVIIITAIALCVFVVKSVIEKKSEAGAKDFAISYLEAYKDIAKKKNFDEAKSLISAEQNQQMTDNNIPLETNYTDFNNYEIVGFGKTKEGFTAKVKLSKGINSLKRPDDNNVFDMRIISEGGEFKSQSWYFTQ